MEGMGGNEVSMFWGLSGRMLEVGVGKMEEYGESMFWGL